MCHLSYSTWLILVVSYLLLILNRLNIFRVASGSPCTRTRGTRREWQPTTRPDRPSVNSSSPRVPTTDPRSDRSISFINTCAHSTNNSTSWSHWRLYLSSSSLPWLQPVCSACVNASNVFTTNKWPVRSSPTWHSYVTMVTRKEIWRNIWNCSPAPSNRSTAPC